MSWGCVGDNKGDREGGTGEDNGETERAVEKLKLPIKFSDLEFTELVGRGGFGEVWKGKWKSRERTVAIKKCNDLEKREVKTLVTIVWQWLYFAVADEGIFKMIAASL